MNWVDLNGGHDVEPRLFEAERHAASAGEQVDRERSGHGFESLGW
jgi:hypothetical protein